MKNFELELLMNKQLNIYYRLKIPFGLENKINRLRQLDMKNSFDLVEWLDIKDEIKEKFG